MLISFEGQNGSGKTTIINELKKLLPSAVYTAEPLLPDDKRSELASICDVTIETMVFIDHQYHLQQISDQLADQIVISERFIDYSFIYYNEPINTSDLRPDLTVIVDVDSKIAKQRSINRQKPSDFDLKTLNFDQTIRQKFLDLPQQFKNRQFLIIDGTKSPKTNAEIVLKAIQSL